MKTKNMQVQASIEGSMSDTTEITSVLGTKGVTRPRSSGLPLPAVAGGHVSAAALRQPDTGADHAVPAGPGVRLITV
jgi:hypothetical protein